MNRTPLVTALVPMKGNSERVPGKNVRPLCGRPLFHWIVESLARSERIGEIVINTDSEAIAEDALRHFDVTILMRPAELCGDMVPIQPLIEHDLASTQGEWYLQTHSTNPLVTTETIDRAIAAFFAQREHDSLFTVTPLQTRFYWPDGRAVNHDPEVLLRTQDLPPIMEENSCLYLFSREVFARRGHRLGSRPLLFPMDPFEAVDIDEEFDFAVAEALMRYRLEGAPAGAAA
jgi:CMP-N-acetylneuraminic acid synthetase